MKITTEKEITPETIRRGNREDAYLTAKALVATPNANAVEVVPLLFACVEKLRVQGRPKGSKKAAQSPV